MRSSILTLAAMLALSACSAAGKDGDVLVSNRLLRGYGDDGRIAAAMDFRRADVVIWNRAFSEIAHFKVEGVFAPSDHILVLSKPGRIAWLEVHASGRRFALADLGSGQVARTPWAHGAVCGAYQRPAEQTFGLLSCEGPLVELDAQAKEIWSRPRGRAAVVGPGGAIFDGAFHPFAAPAGLGDGVRLEPTGLIPSAVAATGRHVAVASALGVAPANASATPQWLKLAVFDQKDGRLLAKQAYPSGDSLSALAVSADGGALYVGFGSGKVEKRTLPDLNLTWSRAVESPVEALSVHEDKLIAKAPTKIFGLPL